MAFNTSSARVVTPSDDSWKATGFLNIYIKAADGTRRKLGALALKDGKSYEKAVIERLTTGGAEAVAALAKVLEIDFVRADAVTPVSAVGF